MGTCVFESCSAANMMRVAFHPALSIPCAGKQHYLKKERLRAAFKAIDLDRSGAIDAAELEQLLGEEQNVTEVLAEIGKGTDDVITFEEFEAIMTSAK